MPLFSKDFFINGIPVPLTAGSSDITYSFNASQTSGDPGSGSISFDSATQNAATTLYLSVTDTSGTDFTNLIDFFGSSTSSDKGIINFRGVTDPTKYLAFKFTSILTNAGYRQFAIFMLESSGATPFANGDLVSVTFFRSGDKGDSGTSGTVVQTRNLRNMTGGTVYKGQPVCLSNATDFALAIGDSTHKAVIGLVADDSILYGSNGNILITGVLTATTAQWDVVTGGSGGLIENGNPYFLNFTTGGMMTNSVNVSTAPAGSFLVQVGYAYSTTEFVLEIEPPIQVA